MKRLNLSALPDALETLMLTAPAVCGIALVLRLCVQPEQSVLLLPAAVTALSLLLCTAFYLFLPRFSSVPPLAILLVGCFLIGPAAVSRGLFAFVNFLISWWNQAYEAGVPLLSVDATLNDLSGFLLLVLLFFAALVWYIVQRRCLWAAMLVVCFWVALPTLALNRFPALGCTFLFTALIGIWLFQRIPGVPKLRIGWFLTVLILLTVLGGFFRTPTPVAAITQLRQSASEGIHHLRFGTTTLPEGDLYRADTMLGDADAEEPTLDVTATVQNTLYLRGYVGGRYVDGVWKPLSGNDYGGDNSGLLSWLSNQSFDVQTQYSAYMTAGSQAYIRNTVTVNNVGTDRSRLYLPYSALPSDAWAGDLEQDSWVNGSGPLGTRYYSFEDTASTLPGELLQQQSWLTDPVTTAEQTYSQTESVYRTFVYDHYLTVDPSLESLIRTTFWSDGVLPSNLYSAAQQIRNVLLGIASYSETPSAVPADEDPIRWFLTGGKGNSALYASAAVEAFRAAGYPARYAEGYLLPGDRVVPGEATTLTTHDSHAWAEVYLDGVGWVPVDVVPGFYLDTYTLQNMVEHPLPIQQSAADSNGDSAAQEETSSESTSTNITTEWENTHISLLGALVLLLILMMTCLTLLAIRRWYLIWVFRSKLVRPHGYPRQAALCRFIIQTLNGLGIECSPGWHTEETDAQLHALIPGFLPGEYTQIARVIERFSFRAAPLSPADERMLYVFLTHLWGERRALPWRLRFRLRYRFFRTDPAEAVSSRRRHQRKKSPAKT